MHSPCQRRLLAEKFKEKKQYKQKRIAVITRWILLKLTDLFIILRYLYSGFEIVLKGFQ